MEDKSNKKHVRVIIECKIAFANIWEPKSINDSTTPKYSVSCLIPKTDLKQIAMIKKAAETVRISYCAEHFGGKTPANFRNPVHDGDMDRPEDKTFANCYYINAISREKPIIVDRHVQPILDPMQVYSGCICKVSFNFYGYKTNVNRGVACGLNHIQLVHAGERLAGRSDPGSIFSDLGDEVEGGYQEYQAASNPGGGGYQGAPNSGGGGYQAAPAGSGYQAVPAGSGYQGAPNSGYQGAPNSGYQATPPPAPAANANATDDLVDNSAANGWDN